MSRRPSTTQSGNVSPSPAPLVAASPIRGLMLAWLAALFAARWLMPTEGSAEGLTLWLVQLVLLTLVARMAWAWRFGERSARFDAIDATIALLITAQVVSALMVVLGVGNARAAINIAWEWVGSGVLIWLLRQELRATRAVRPLCLGLSLAAAVLAGYGLWQHFFWYDEMSREYERLTTEHDRLSQSPSDGRRLQSLQAEMARQNIPIDPAARQLLEQRLKASREPFGLFALANTFAGLLAVMLPISLGAISGLSFRFGTQDNRATVTLLALSLVYVYGILLLPFVSALTMAFCLLLTKSRTAWVGLSAGVAWWVLRVIAARLRHEGNASPPTRWSSFRTWLVAGVVLAGIAIGIAAVSGGLDRAVFSEAPKSLRYRLEYWQGTWATIREQIWFGTGPGNFRDHYLAHKLPESSEEIADPHNFVLDVWANAGMFGLIGLLACIGLMVSQAFRRPGTNADNAANVEEPPHEVLWTSPAVWGVGLAFPLSAMGMDFFGYGTDERLWWLGGIWWALWLSVMIWSRGSGDSFVARWPLERTRFPVALEAANVALLVHLLGAGGIAMPAITQLLWLVWSLRVACSEPVAALDEKSPSESASGGVKAGRLPVGACVLAVGGLCVLCGWSATMPELLCRTSLQLGDAEWGRSPSAARQRYLDANRADPYAIEPLDRLADVAFQRWQNTRSDQDFDESMKYRQMVADVLPFASRPFRRLGQTWLARFEHSHDARDATRAVAAFDTAVERYPHHAELLSEWAVACEKAGLLDKAREAARRAVRQDELNRLAGHSDKYLDGPTRERLERLIGEASEPN